MLTNQELAKFLKHVESPFDEKLGIKVIKVEKGKAILELETKRDFTNNIGLIHGGVTFSLCDTAMGLAALTLGIDSVTVEMKINYLSPVKADEKITAIGKVLKKGRTFVIAESVVYQEDKLVAKSIGTHFVQNPTENERRSFYAG